MRLLPLFQEAERRNPDELKNLSNCETCMAGTTVETRQYLRCGYEPPAAPGVPTQAYQPPGYKPRPQRAGAEPVDDPAVCPGYTTKLPEVVDVARARLHYKNNALAVWLRGEPATDHLLLGLEILESAVNECESLKMTPVSEGGLRA